MVTVYIRLSSEVGGQRVCAVLALFSSSSLCQLELVFFPQLASPIGGPKPWRHHLGSDSYVIEQSRKKYVYHRLQAMWCGKDIYLY